MVQDSGEPQLFRRRQTASRTATFAEAFSSIAWAAIAALWAIGTWLAAIAGALALLILFGAWLISPRDRPPRLS